MDYEDWESHYKQILRDFDFDRRWDEIAAAVLVERLSHMVTIQEQVLERVIRGKDVFILADSDVELDPRVIARGIRIAADGATTKLKHIGVVPEVIVTDLDGKVQDQVDANYSGAICLIHAHGDNIDAIREWTCRFSGRIAGTTQSRPFAMVYNFGGFTDGDRGALLAKHFGARTINLVGWDFENPKPKDGKDPDVKRQKLLWAKRLIDEHVPEARFC